MKRDLVPTAIRTEFGEVMDDAAFRAPMGANKDFTYVPGYSDIRRARDLAKGLAQAERESYSADEDEAARGRQGMKLIQGEIRRALSQTGMTLPDRDLRPQDVPTLPARLHWVRTAKVISGQPDTTKELDAAQNGYRKVTTADVGQPWLRDLPIGASVLADGSIFKGDTCLMVCDAKDAARNAALNQREVQLQTQRVAADVQTLETAVADAPVKVRSRKFSS